MDYDDNENDFPNQNYYDENTQIHIKESSIKTENQNDIDILKDPINEDIGSLQPQSQINNKPQTQTTFISKTNQPNTKSYQKSTNLHVHKPVPKSKLEKAEDKYYELKKEIEDKIFANSHDDTYLTSDLNNPSTVSRKNKEMITYLEKLNNVLTEIIENTKITNKQNARLRRANQQQSNEQLMQEQEQLNDNSQKLIIAYKKEYLNLEAKLNKVSKNNYAINLEQELKDIENEINRLHSENKKLQNEQKLNDIVLSKLNKGDNKSEIELKRLAMDHDSLKRQKITLENKLKQKKQVYNDNGVKITNLNDFQEKLENIAKDMYNITQFENVKNEEKNQKRKEKIKQNLIYKIGILQKAVSTNQKKYNVELKQNIKKINEMKGNKQLVIENYIKSGGVYQDDKYYYPHETNYDIQEESKHKKKYNNDIPQINKEEKVAVLKEIDNILKEKHRENDEEVIYNNNNDINHILIEDNVQHEQCQVNNNINNVTKDDIVNNRTADLISDHNEKEDNQNDKEENDSKHDDTNKEENEEKENTNNNDDNIPQENEIPHKEEIPKFLEGFVDDDNGDNNQLDKSATQDVINNDINISNKAIKNRRSKIEILQKESFDNLIKLNKVNIQPERERLNEYEELEEFQI